jgi:integrase
VELRHRLEAAWQRIRDRAGVPDVRIHDLRRTLGSWLAAANYGLPMIGAALNHSSPASTAVYARLALDPVRTMLEANAVAMVAAMQPPEIAPPAEAVKSKRKR